MKNLFDNAVQQSVISSSAMEKETSLLVHSAMNHIIIGNPMCCGAYAQNAISAIKISHPERFEGVKDYFTDAYRNAGDTGCHLQPCDPELEAGTPYLDLL